MKKLISTLLLLTPLISDAGTLGLHLQSIHDRPYFNDDNPGIYLKTRDGFTVGTYYNSEYRQSTYVGATISAKGVEISTLLITGYNASVLPVIIPSILIKDKLRVSLLANPFGASALHFSFEGKF